MADKKKAAEGASVNDAEATDKAAKKKEKKKAAEGGAASDVEAAGKAAKKKAAPPEVAAVAEPAPKPQTKSTKIPKLAKKNKSRLPRRQKKALRKAEAAQRIQTGDRR
jgi:hypothetical protein